MISSAKWFLVSSLVVVLVDTGCSNGSYCDRIESWNNFCSSTCETCTNNASSGACAMQFTALDSSMSPDVVTFNDCASHCPEYMSSGCEMHQSCSCLDMCYSQASSATRALIDDAYDCAINACQSACQ